MAIDKISDSRAEFNAHLWEVGEAITKANMNTLENHVKAANDLTITDRNKINLIIDEVNSNSSDISSLKDTVGTTESSGLRGRVLTLETAATNNEGHTAMVLILGATTENSPSYNTLDSRFGAIESNVSGNYTTLDNKIDSTKTELSGNISGVSGRIGDVETEISTARVTYGNVYDTSSGASVSATTLGQVLKDVDRRITSVAGTAGDVLTSINTNNVVGRLNALDNNETIATNETPYNVPQIISELRNTHKSTANAEAGESYHSYDYLDDRLEADETKINVNTAAIGSLNDNKVSKSDVRNDFTHTDTNLPLSAGAGKQLRDLIGGTYSSSNTVTAYIDSSAATAESNANAYTDSINTAIDTRLDAIDGGNGQLDRDLPDIIDELDDAHTSSVVKEENAQHQMVDKTYASLDDRLEAIETHKKTIQDEITEAHTSSVVKEEDALHQLVNKEYNSLDERFEAIETHKKNILDEITAAHTSSVIKEENALHELIDKTYTTLDDRLEAIETHAAAVRTDVNTIADELSMRDLQVISGVNSRVDRLNDNVLALGKEIGMLSEDTTLLPLADAIDRDSTRIDDIDSEIIAAHKQTGVDVQENPIYEFNNLNARFTDIDSKISHLANALNNDAGGLTERLTAVEEITDRLSSDLNTASTGLKARITTAEGDIDTLLSELVEAHKQTGTENDEPVYAYTSIDERFDDIEYQIDHAIDENDENDIGGLLQLIASNTHDISHNIDTANNDPGGILERLAAAESALSGQSGTMNSLVTTDLLATELAKKADKTVVDAISTTIILDNSQVNYEVDGKTPASFKTGVPVEKDDYLILENKLDGKYYYWKYINNTWHLMGGAGGSGSSNAEDYNSFADFSLAEKETNKDYYVLQDNIRHHYRYLKSVDENEEVTWTRIEIGVPTDLLKSYLIARALEIDETTRESIEYLDLYGFALGTTVSPENVENITNYTSYRIGRVELPKGGEGGSSRGHRIYAKVRGELAQRMSWSAAESGGVRLNYGYTCYSYNDVDGYDYLSLLGTLTDENNNVIENYNIPYLTYESYTNDGINITTKNLFPYCVKNDTKAFTLTLHANVNNETIPDKVLTVYVTLVELALTSTFTDLQTYSINNNLTIPYQFNGMSDATPEFEVLLDNTQLNDVTITSTNIIIRKESLTNKKGIHNLSIRVGLMVNGSMLYSDPLLYQIGFIDGLTDTLMLFSGVSLDENLTVILYKIKKLPYYLYVPSGETIEVSYKAERLTYNNEHEIISKQRVPELNRANETLSTGSYTYNFRIHEMVADTEYYLITISAENQELEFYITVNKADEQINIRTDDLIFDFKPERFSNNVATEEERLWTETRNGITYKMRIPEGAHFDWRTGGWMTVNEQDKQDIPCFCVRAGSRVEFVKEENGVTSPLTLFWENMEELGGSDFKCTFKIDNVKTPNTPFLTSLDKEVNTIINYGKLILASKLDLEDDDTLLHNYINTQYIYTTTINNKNKVVKEAISNTVLNNAPFYELLTLSKCDEATVSARASNKKKIKKYIGNIYDIVRQASVQEHQEYLLRVLSGKAANEVIDYSTIKQEIIDYLFNELLYDELNANNTNATTVYNRLVSESIDTASTTYAYRLVEPINFDALLNGFIVEGKDGKDGIIAMILFTFASTIETTNKFTQTYSLISTNSFTKTGTFKVTATNILTQTLIENGETPETKYYEVEMSDPNSNGTYTEIVNIKDASNIEVRSYGLELNALGSNIYLPSGVVSYAHSEGDMIDFEYNIHPAIANHVNSSIIIYEDGVPSAAKLYTNGNNVFELVNPGCLTIGSDECDVYIYKMRLYNKSIGNEDILANFYADGLTPDDMIERYDRNKNLVANANNLTPQLVAQECPDLRVIMIEAPTLTGGKTSFIKNTKIRLIYKNGRPEDNWIALNAYHAGQGTSSDNYGAAGRNLDIIFGFDGEDTVIIPKPLKNNYTFDPNYKSIVVTGLDGDTTNDIMTTADLVTLINENKEDGVADVTVNELNNPALHLAASAYHYQVNNLNVYTGGQGKVSFTDESIPNNWFNIKVNIASSENTNNAFLQKRFDKYLPYDTPAKLRDSRIKNDMEFFNCVIFIKEVGTASEFTDDNSIAAADRPWHFYGIGNIGDSKKTDKTRVNVPGDPQEFCLEVSDNGLKLSGFCSGVFYISEASKQRSKASESPYKLDELNAKIAELNTEYNTASADDKVRIQNEINTLNGYTVAATALSAETFKILTSSEYNVDNNVYSFLVANPDATTIYAVPIANDSFTYYRRFMYINSTWTEVGEPITFERTTYGIKYPISEAEWKAKDNNNNNINSYYDTLYDINSGKGWDKSYEFRYDLTTKDGETVSRNDTEAALNKLRQNVNKLRFADMYSWIVTSSNEGFKKNLGDWFIKESPLYWYLFTERYTMIDSRAKNTFYHCGKVYITEAEANGTNIPTLELAVLNAQTEIDLENAQAELAVAQFLRDNSQYFKVNNTLADANHNYGYRFEMWDYDNDTALGINNNGQMVFSAGLEDIDKDVSGWIYNEAESVIWRRVRENMYDDLGALYVRLKTECFNAENLILEFDNLQSQFPEELWRLDFERKYYRPFEKSNETTYLNDMANGRKRYQRRLFERNMAIYINSKYQRNGSYIPNDLISFRPQISNNRILNRDTDQIIIKPYSTMYINFALGNSDNTGESNSAVSTRVQRGEAYTIHATDYIHDFNNIQCIIYNASRIMELDGLGNFESKQFILGTAEKLSVLKLGHPDFVNVSMEAINNMGLSAGLPLLEELDLTNIQFLQAPDTFALENFPLLKRFNATGCNIRSFTFKDGGMLESIIFPSVLTKIDFKNLYNLVDTEDENHEIVPAVHLTGAANLVSYNSTNSYKHSYEIVLNMLNNAGRTNSITSLKLDDIEWTIVDLIDLQSLVELLNRLGNNMLLAGTITVTGKWSTVKLNDYKAAFGVDNITWVMTSTAIPEYKLTFYLSEQDWNNKNTYYTEYRSPLDGNIEVELGDDPVYIGTCSTPIKEPTISTSYYFGTNALTYYPWSGWLIRNNALTLSNSITIQANTDLIAVFGQSVRTYPLCWYLNEDDEENDINPIKTINNMPYGGSYEDGIAPSVFDLKKAGKVTATLTPLEDGINCSYSIFNGWAKNPINLDSSFFNDAGDKFCIYGDWDSGIEAINTIKNLVITDARKLLVLTNSNSADNILPVNSTITIDMGHDNETGITLVGPGATQSIGSPSKLYDGSSESNPILNFTYYVSNNRINILPTACSTGITPFSDMTSRGFTIAIDYQINIDYLRSAWTDGYAIIGGCYTNASAKQGFAVYYDLNQNVTKVCFGDLDQNSTYSSSNYSCAISNTASAESRNIVIIRHKANTNTLDIYSGISATSGMILSLSNDNIKQTLTYSKNTTNSPLCFGHFTTTNWSTLSGVHPGAGVSIHWAKYWNSDLGHNECVNLVSWPHETLTFALEDYSNDGNQDILNTTSKNMIFSALSLSLYGGPYYLNYSTTLGTTVNWGTTLDNNNNSTYKKLANLRFFSGLPISLLSIISLTYNKAVLTTLVKGFLNYYEFSSSNDSTDLVFLPTYAEAGGDLTGSHYSQYNVEASRAVPWNTAANTWVSSYGTNTFDLENITMNLNYMNLRFFGVPINIGANENHVYVGYTGSTPVYDKIIANNNRIRKGDIFIYVTLDEDQNETISTYIYADGLAKAQGAPTIIAESNTLLYCNSGGWVKSGSWWTRTPSSSAADNIVKAQALPIYYVSKSTGTLVKLGVPDGYGGYFVYEFGI